ncbi:unnamed protein product [Staurois parvus]|uniref:Uncharacterized protein n=1 Tax=Staurois parvus TaxID=386267 RepID=A0ABN9B5F2_9NEOB|nr:unnamed protein product [Staurois parvus]
MYWFVLYDLQNVLGTCGLKKLVTFLTWYKEFQMLWRPTLVAPL